MNEHTRSGKRLFFPSRIEADQTKLRRSLATCTLNPIRERASFFPVEMLSALSLLSEELAERVRVVRGESPEEAPGRVEVFRRRLGLRQLQGSPHDRFLL